MSQVGYGPKRGLIVLGFALGLVLGYFGVQAKADGDNAGATLMLAGGIAIASAAGWALAGPVLVVSTSGVRIRQPFGHVSYPWSAVEAFSASTQRRRGLSQRNLEIEAEDRLHLLPDWLLGAAELSEIVAAAEELRA